MVDNSYKIKKQIQHTAMVMLLGAFICCLAIINAQGYFLVNTHAETSSAKTTVRLQILPSNQTFSPPLTLIRIGNTEGLLFTLGPITFIDGTLLPNIDAELYIQVKGRSDYITLKGRTNDDAKLIFDSSKSLAEQGLTISAGDPAILVLINASNDVTDAYGAGIISDQRAESNHVIYKAPPKPTTPTPTPTPTPIRFAPVPRTGGDATILGVTIGMAILTTWVIIERSTAKKSPKSVKKR